MRVSALIEVGGGGCVVSFFNLLCILVHDHIYAYIYHINICIYINIYICIYGDGMNGKKLASQHMRPKRCGFDPWVGKIPWRRA